MDLKKIVLASDSFKGTLSSTEICELAKETLSKELPDCELLCIPAADGGEGTVDCFVSAIGAKRVNARVCGPLFDPLECGYAVSDRVAIIEMSAAAGLPLLPKEKQNPLYTTTFGVGELIKHAVLGGAKELLIGLGGSSTTDAGCGMAAALGCRFYDKNGREFVPVGGTLCRVKSVDISGCKELLAGVNVSVMCDVTNPLYGKKGAAYVFGPQKGADKRAVRRLNRGLVHIARIMKKELKTDISRQSGAGAAGGMGAGCRWFLGGELKSGSKAILDAVGFNDIIKDADLVITGEGKLDSQSFDGKLLSEVLKRTSDFGVPLAAIVGILDKSAQSVLPKLAAVEVTNTENLPFEEAAKRADKDYKAALVRLLKRAGEDL